MSFNKELIQAVWEKGTPLEGCDPDTYRYDVCGAVICRIQYGNKNADFGWEIDHIYPKSKLEKQNLTDDEIDSYINLQPLHCVNNERKSDDYPTFHVGLSHMRLFHEDEVVEIAPQFQQEIKKYFENIKMERIKAILRSLGI